ncbi:MAG: hypothetical protein IPK04_08655 [Bdellovibrionales bacterium]|nr:hypothetical protein [Bdellovibrionales bacterium]
MKIVRRLGDVLGLRAFAFGLPMIFGFQLAVAQTTGQLTANKADEINPSVWCKRRTKFEIRQVPLKWLSK